MIQALEKISPKYPGQSLSSWDNYELETPEHSQMGAAPLISGSIYIYDLVEQRNLGGSCSVAKMLDYPCGVKEPFGLASLIHPDDLNRVADYFQKFSTLRYDEVVRIEYRMRRADGDWCWLRSQETPLVMAIDGFPLQILGIIQLIPPTASPEAPHPESAAPGPVAA